MYNFYHIYIRETTVSRNFRIRGCEAAFDAYKASVAWVEAMGLDATVDMVDGETGEILASTYNDEED